MLYSDGSFLLKKKQFIDDNAVINALQVGI